MLTKEDLKLIWAREHDKIVWGIAVASSGEAFDSGWEKAVETLWPEIEQLGDYIEIHTNKDKEEIEHLQENLKHSMYTYESMLERETKRAEIAEVKLAVARDFISRFVHSCCTMDVGCLRCLPFREILSKIDSVKL